MRRARRRRRRRRRSACASPPTQKTAFGGTRAGSHTPWIQSAATFRLRNARRKSKKRPWDSPGAFSYAVYAMRIPLEGSLAVFLGYVLVFPLSLFDFRANAALNRLSEAFRLSRAYDLQATLRLPATLGERLPRRLSDSPTLPDSQRLPDSPTPSDFRLPTSDPLVARHPPTTLRDTARNTGTPRGRHDRPRRGRNDHARCGGTRRRARQKHSQTPRLYIARKVARKVYKSY